jgi:hypothetical protein
MSVFKGAYFVQQSPADKPLSSSAAQLNQ